MNLSLANRILVAILWVGLLLLLPLSCAAEAGPAADHARGLRLYQTYQSFDADLKNACVVLCHLPTGGNVLSDALPISTRIKVKEPK